VRVKLIILKDVRNTDLVVFKEVTCIMEILMHPLQCSIWEFKKKHPTHGGLKGFQPKFWCHGMSTSLTSAFKRVTTGFRKVEVEAIRKILNLFGISLRM
jgi:hypothetical protein